MKKIQTIVFGLILICLPSLSFSQCLTCYRYYGGISGAYAFEYFEHKSPVNFRDTYGVEARLGYRSSKFLAVELELSHLMGFRYNTDVISTDPFVRDSAKIDITTYMLTFKPLFDFHPFIPFFSFGLGVLQADVTPSIASGSYITSVSNTEEDVGAKLGIGLNYHLTEFSAVVFEADYVLGFKDVDKMRFLNCSLGISRYF